MRCIKTSWSVWSVDTNHHGKSLVLRLGQLIRDQEQVLNPSASMFKTLCVVCFLEQVTIGCIKTSWSIWSVDTDHYGKSLVLRLGLLIRDQEQALKPIIMLKKKYSSLHPAHVFKSTRTPAARCTGETQIPCQMLSLPTLSCIKRNLHAAYSVHVYLS
jgi:hypothetical protein